MSFENTTFDINANGFPGQLDIGPDGATGTIYGTDQVDMFVADGSMIRFRRTMGNGLHQYYTGGYMQVGAVDYRVVASGTFTEENDTGVYTWQAQSELIPG